MQLSLKKIDTRMVLAGLALAFIAMLMVPDAMAGTDATFAAFNTKIESWLNGSLGILIAFITFCIGLYNAVRQNSMMSIFFPFFISIIVTVGITVIKGGFTAMI